MSEEAFDKAKMAQLQSENAQMQATIQACSGQIRARKQCAEELFEANINLRASNILMEDHLKKLQTDMAGMKDMIFNLENKNAALIKEKEAHDAQAHAAILD